MIDGLLGCEESRCHTVVHILSLETNPVAFPSGMGVRMVGMPFAGEEQEHITCLDRCLRTMGTLEDPFTLGVIEQLVFIEHPTFLEIEIITVCMSFRGIVFSGGDLFISHRTDGQSPEGITLIGQ